MKKLLIWTLKIYNNIASPFLARMFGNACRFTPTCSQYTIDAVEKFGVARGGRLGITRFSKCHPWGSFGFDPVPTKT